VAKPPLLPQPRVKALRLLPLVPRVLKAPLLLQLRVKALKLLPLVPRVAKVLRAKALKLP
jgi:hypothetical protein